MIIIAIIVFIDDNSQKYQLLLKGVEIGSKFLIKYYEINKLLVEKTSDFLYYVRSYQTTNQHKKRGFYEKKRYQETDQKAIEI